MSILGRKPRLTAEQHAELRETAREWIDPGFRRRAGLAEGLVEYYEDIDAPEEVLREAAQRVVDEVWRDRLAEESGWTDTGDFGRLERAFAALAEQGLVCKMDFTCCQTCGTAEIDDERTARESSGEGEYPYNEWAYTFFHQQDAEGLAHPDAMLRLSYSAFMPAPGIDPDLMLRAKAGDEEARQDVFASTDRIVGEIVRDALVAEGLEVEWNGTSAQRIGIRVSEWRKPLPRD